jgi:hypothetical protein
VHCARNNVQPRPRPLRKRVAGDSLLATRAGSLGLNLCGPQTQDGKVNEARLSGAATAIARYRPGEMAEWLKAHAWKACVPQGTVGSNPTLSASGINYNSQTLTPRLLAAIDGRDLPIDAQRCRGGLLDDISFIVSRFNRLTLGIRVHEGDSLLLYALGRCITAMKQLRP